MDIDLFIHHIEEFDNLSASRKIDFFVYYHTVVLGNDGANVKDINSYFDVLKLSKYSNVSSYLSKNSKKTKGKTNKYIYHKGAYHLERTNKIEIDEVLKKPKELVLTHNYFPSDIFDNTRGYLESISKQAIGCYDVGLYDACAVMTRKLLEILIIESFERFLISNKIKNTNGNFYYLSDLIDIFNKENIWNIGRNAQESLKSLKKMGDLSAHNRRYIARKGDLDKIKGDLRIVLEELIHLINYPNWK